MSAGCTGTGAATVETNEIEKGDCHDCPWYENCPRMRGISLCYSDVAAGNLSQTEVVCESADSDDRTGLNRR